MPRILLHKHKQKRNNNLKYRKFNSNKKRMFNIKLKSKKKKRKLKLNQNIKSKFNKFNQMIFNPTTRIKMLKKMRTRITGLMLHPQLLPMTLKLYT